jgi:hypothetical protein
VWVSDARPPLEVTASLIQLLEEVYNSGGKPNSPDWDGTKSSVNYILTLSSLLLKPVPRRSAVRRRRSLS